MWMSSLGQNLDRLTDRAIKVLRVARDRATTNRDPQITPEHVLWALANVERGPGRLALERLGVDLRKSLRELELLHTACSGDPHSAPVPSPEVDQLLQNAKAQAKLLRHDYVGTEHLILGLLSGGTCPALHFLHQRGIGLDRFREAVLWVLDGEVDVSPHM